MGDLILTNGNNTIIQSDTSQDTITPTNIYSKAIIETNTNNIQESNVKNVLISSNDCNITKDDDKYILDEGKVLTSYETIINRLVEQYYDNPSSILTIKNCLAFGENNTPKDVYTKEEIRELLTNYYTKEEILNLFVNTSCTTGEMFDFYLDGLNVTENKPISTKQISFSISNNNSESRIFSIRILNSTILHNGALFNLWLYLNGLSLSSEYTIETILKTATSQKISEGKFILKPSTLYELFLVPMNTNFLENSINLLPSEILYLTVTITKTTEFLENISIVTGPENLSRLTINNNQLTANNIFDYKEGNTYSQSELNNSIIWENF